MGIHCWDETVISIIFCEVVAIYGVVGDFS